MIEVLLFQKTGGSNTSYYHLPFRLLETVKSEDTPNRMERKEERKKERWGDGKKYIYMRSSVIRS